MAAVERPEEAARLLTAAGMLEPPIPVERLARQHGAHVRFEPSRTDLAGMLFRHDGQSIIGVNSLLPRTRQRFTIAHELGHLLLHPGDGLHIDRNFRPGGTPRPAAGAGRLSVDDLSVESLTPGLTLDVEAPLGPTARGDVAPVDIRDPAFPHFFAGLTIPDPALSMPDDRADVEADAREHEANRFAADLLLPADRLRSEFVLDVDYEDDEVPRRLATRYQVSLQLLLRRLSQLGIFLEPA